MNERKLSALQKEYRVFFLGKLEKYSVSSPAELTKERKSQFFTEIKRDWTEYKLSKKRKRDAIKKEIFLSEPSQVYEGNESEEEAIDLQRNGQGYSLTQFQGGSNKDTEYKPDIKQSFQREGNQVYNAPKQIIKSQINDEQTDDLKILFSPNEHFLQPEFYEYPVVKMPRHNSLLKLPRLHRSNQKGFKENDFYNQIRQNIADIEITNDVHMVIPNFSKPYEPDIVLFDKTLNLYIDIEIDEPYDGYYRYPTHFINPEDDSKKDNVRDLFFNESGWVVIRFTEKQVHCQPQECIDYIKNVMSSIYGHAFTNEARCTREPQWDYNQCIQWEKLNYREKYLGIDRFQKQYSRTEIRIDTEQNDSIEHVIQRTKKFDFNSWNASIAFDEESHRYIHPKDETGNAEYISVTTLIERFFPFDLKRYVEVKATKENRTEEEVLDEYLLIRDEAAEKGTFLHGQIENYLKGMEHDAQSVEFEFFLNFFEQEIQKRNLLFYDAEKIIFSNKHNVAGTIDCLFQKKDKDEYVMLDWKRSKKLIIDGYPRIFGFGLALSELSHLDNSSYYRYCLQQNIYKHIVETEYSMKISSMKLVVLHEDNLNYHVVNVPTMNKETNIILTSLKVKI